MNAVKAVTIQDVNSLRYYYRQACAEREAAWRKYSEVIDQRPSRETIEAHYQQAIDADRRASTLYAAFEAAKAAYLQDGAHE